MMMAMLAAWMPVFAQTASSAVSIPPSSLKPVVVTSTRIGVSPFAAPASVDVIDGETMRHSQPQVNLSESLGGVPGLLIQNRQNYAQDLQIAVRGFGSRSTFGIRGVRLYVDGIPATLPDGQGQSSNIDIASIDRVEILRGPFSALYGNSSGGVIQVFTEEGRGAPAVAPSCTSGSDGLRRYGIKAGGSAGGSTSSGAGAIDYVLSASRFTTDGYRAHSAARKNLVNGKLGIRLDDDSKLTLVINGVDLKAQDPLGLDWIQFRSNPRSVAAIAEQFDTRKAVRQSQGGLVHERRIDAGFTRRLGVQGRLRRDESNEVWNIDPYLQASWQFAGRWVLDAGLRHSMVRFSSDDHYIAGINGDDSGAASRRRPSMRFPIAAMACPA